jgi:hypothetical protein
MNFQHIINNSPVSPATCSATFRLRSKNVLVLKRSVQNIHKYTACCHCSTLVLFRYNRTLFFQTIGKTYVCISHSIKSVSIKKMLYDICKVLSVVYENNIKDINSLVKDRVFKYYIPGTYNKNWTLYVSFLYLSHVNEKTHTHLLPHIRRAPLLMPLTYKAVNSCGH